MEMHQVRYFLAVARALNFTRAADSCHVTQPSLTRAIQKLEEELGGELFRRERALTHLTDLGRLMLPHLERTFEAAQAAKALAKGVGKAEVAPLRLGLADGLCDTSLMATLKEVGEGLPGFDLTLANGASEALIDSALQGDLDLIVVEAPDAPHERLETWTLRRRAYRIALPQAHAFMGADELTLGELTGLTLIGGGPGAARLRAAADAAGVSLVARHEAAGADGALALAAAGLGAAVVPADVALPPGVAARPVAGVDLDGMVILCAIAGRRRAPAADAFLRAARARAWA